MWLDLRLALRSFSRSPGFAVVTVLLVALGVGATTSIFSVVDAVLLRSLPYPQADRIVYFQNSSHSYPLFRDWQDSAHAFDLIAAAQTESVALVGDGAPEDVRAAMVTVDLLPLFGGRAAEGRLLEGDDFGERRDVVVLSQALWQSRWGGDPGVVGGSIDLDGKRRTVVGVLGPGFRPPAAVTGSEVDVWLPLDPDQELMQKRNIHILEVAARLAPGRTREEAQGEIDAVATSNAERYPETDRRRDGKPLEVPLVSIHEATVGRISSTLLMLMGSVLMLLLIACANVASLFLARATTREREIAVRSALGAGRGRLARQLLTESVALALLGGVLGSLLAWVGVRAFRAMGPQDLPRLADVGVDLRVLGFAAVASVLTGVLFGTVPALRLGQDESGGAIGHTRSTAGARTQRLRSLLVVAEIAMALVLLVGAGLLFNSFLRTVAVDPGFDTERLVRLSLRRGGFGDGGNEARIEFTRQALEEIEALPGVARAAAGWTMPFDFTGGGRCCWRSGFRPAEEPDRDPVAALIHPITPGYFQVLGAPLLAGRELDWRDQDAEAAPAIINREMARELFGDIPAAAALDRVVAMTNEQSFVVVGVVEDYQHYGLREDREPFLFVSYAAFGGGIPMVSIAVRTSAPLEQLADSLRQRVWNVDPQQPIGDLVEVDRRIARSVAEPRFYSLLLGLFAGTSLLLAAGGIYGALLYSVGQRRRELGVRLALGARPREVATLVLGQGARLAFVGIALGLAGAIGVSRFLDSMLFGVGRYDPATLTAVCAVLATVVLAACWVPARRAAAVDPALTLRSD